VYAPVGPSAPTCAIATMASVPSRTVLALLGAIGTQSFSGP
jgi:hypothetical protein